MTFLSVLLVLAFVQWWGSGAPLQKDGWFHRYTRWLSGRLVQRWPSVELLLAVLLPALVLWGLCWLVDTQWAPIWALVIAVPVLLYSLGRGDFSACLKAYIHASEREDSVGAARYLAELQGDEPDEVEPEDWPTLHRQALKAVAYRSCERMFAVIFWFVILGPAGALLYRLSVLYREQNGPGPVHTWIWLLEWPVVRILGLTWSMAGNFDSCFFRCQRELLDIRQSASVLLYDQILGALGNTDAAPGQARVELDTIRASQSLFSRSLLLWVCVLALLTLLT